MHYGHIMTTWQGGVTLCLIINKQWLASIVFYLHYSPAQYEVAASLIQLSIGQVKSCSLVILIPQDMNSESDSYNKSKIITCSL